MISAFGVDHGEISKSTGPEKVALAALTRSQKMTRPGLETAGRFGQDLAAQRNKMATPGASRGLVRQQLMGISAKAKKGPRTSYQAVPTKYERRFPKLGRLSWKNPTQWRGVETRQMRQDWVQPTSVRRAVYRRKMDQIPPSNREQL